MQMPRLATFALLAIAVCNATQAQYTYTFQPQVGNSGDWNDWHNWDRQDQTVPGSDDYAIVPAGKTCNVSAASQSVHQFEVQKSGATNGVLHIDSGRMLTVYDNDDAGDSSILDGVIELGTSTSSTSRLRFANRLAELPINGAGSIDARRNGGTGSGIIDTDGPTSRVVLDPGIHLYGSIEFQGYFEGGAFVVDDDDDDMVFSGVLYDGSLTVSAGSANVNSGYHDGDLWDVLVTGGSLVFNDPTWDSVSINVEGGEVFVLCELDGFPPQYAPEMSISGGDVYMAEATWRGPLTISSGTLTFVAEYTLMGSLTVTGGTVYVEEDVTGEVLSWNNGGSFVIAPGKTLVFNGAP